MTIPNTLSEKTVAEIESLTRKISVAQELDVEIQAELRGHIEDKVRGYVSGAVKVSETDALLLAKAHFGDAAVIKGMFQGAHGAAHAESLVRRLSAAFVATMVVAAVIAILDEIGKTWVVYPLAVVEKSGVIHFPAQHFLYTLFILVLEAGLLWTILYFWRRRQRSGHHLWFERWNFVEICMMLMVAVGGFIGIECGVRWFSVLRLYEWGNTTFGMYIIGWILECLSRGTQACLWIWWADGAPRTWKSLSCAIVCWIVTTRFVVFIFAVVGYASMSDQISVSIVARWGWALRSSMVLNVGVEMLVGLLALVVYLSVTRSKLISIAT